MLSQPLWGRRPPGPPIAGSKPGKNPEIFHVHLKIWLTSEHVKILLNSAWLPPLVKAGKEHRTQKLRRAVKH